MHAGFAIGVRVIDNKGRWVGGWNSRSRNVVEQVANRLELPVKETVETIFKVYKRRRRRGGSTLESRTRSVCRRAYARLTKS